MSRKIDLMLKRIQEQNYLDQKILSREAKINANLVNHLNKQREELHNKTERRERRFQEGRIRNELARLGKSTIIDNNKRRHTFDSKINTYKSMNYLLYPTNKNNIFTHINNYNYVFDKKENYRKDFNNNIINKTNGNTNRLYNFQRKKYFADIFDNLYNQNNDKKFLSNDIIFFLNRAVSDEIKENKDYQEALKYERYMNYLKNKNNSHDEMNTIYTNKHIDAKTRYNDYFLDQDDLLNKKVNDLRVGKIENDDPFKTIPMDENKKRIILKEKLWKKNRDEKMKKINEENQKKYNAILAKETNKFIIANNKENNCLMNKNNAMLGSVFYKENMEQKAKEAQIRYDRVFKGDTVYKKGEYEMPDTH